MSDRYEIALAGTGGQGLILAGLILAEAAALFDGKNAVQSQDYGPEARGGASKSEVIVSGGEIGYPKVMAADLLLAMSQESVDKYFHKLKKNGILVVDSDLVTRIPTSKAYRLPLTATALEKTGKKLTASVVALGAIVALTHVVSREAITAAVTDRAPKGTAELNQKALSAGFELVAKLAPEKPVE
jgi:2-oxoglutarate ferredoxin oxidoreductase subunit gamma